MPPYFSKSFLLSATLLLVLLSAAPAQDHYFDPLLKRFDDYRLQNLHEKIYLHTDKQFYLAGEICWFSMYDVDGTLLRPLDLSKLAYVELLDKDNKPLLQARIELDSGRGNGSFYLPVSLQSGNYLLRAYTNWMKNAGPAYFFEQRLTIVNSFSPLPAAVADSGTSIDAQFFPEGGNLVEGIESVVAFKVNDKYGRAVSFHGVLENDKGDTLLQFDPLHLGMGHFRLKPEGNTNYIAIVTLPNGHTLKKTLPLVYENGYVMQVRATGEEGIQVKVDAKPALTGAHANEVYLLIHARQQLTAAIAAQVNNGTAIFNISRGQMADGVSHITLFNGTRQPVCERLIFKYPSHKLEVETRVDKTAYLTRQPVQVELKTKDESGNALPGDLSVAVYRRDDLSAEQQDDIYSYLWLSSDLHGWIESPGWYFSENSAATREAMDNLMLTQGWRRFDWDDLLTGDPGTDANFPPENDGILITGTVSDDAGRPITESSISISVPGNRLLFQQVLSNDQGKILFNLKDYYGQNQVIVKPMGEKPGNYHITLDNPFSDQYANRILPPFHFDPKNKDGFVARNVSMQVQNVFTGAKTNVFEEKHWDSLPFFGKPRDKYNLDDYTRFVTMEEVLREYVQMVAVRRYGGKLHLRMIDESVKDLFRDEPLILLDGVPLNSDSILSFDPLKVKKLELINKRFIRGGFIYDGIVSFTTYDGKPENIPMGASDLLLDYEGLQLKREFYSPAYESGKEMENKLPDFRQLLYWSPAQITGRDGKATFSFFTSDVPGEYIIVLQGCANQGRVGSSRISFKVQEREEIH